MLDFNSIPERPPRSISLLSGLQFRAILDRSIIYPFIFIVMIVGLLPALMFLSMEKSFRLPFIEMEQTDGTITEVVETSKCDRRSILLHYQFMTKTNRTYYGKFTSCEGNLYSALNTGDIIPIIYDPNDPTFNGVEGEIGKNDPPFLIFIIFPLFFILIFFPMFLPNIKQIMVARSIFKKGIITKGEIVYVGRKKLTNAFNFKMITNFDVFYCFKTVTGETIESKVNTDNDWLANKLTFGSPVTISYLERKPKRSIVLDFYYR